MIAGLKPYAEYKESGQDWIGKIPSHWDLKPGHAAYSKRKVPNIGLKENTVLSLSYGRIKVKSVEKQHGLVPASYETYQIVDEGNIIIRGTDLQNDKTSLRIGLARNRGIISSAYLCLEARDAVLPEFGYQILNTYDLTKAIYRYGSGLRQNLDHGEIKRLPIFLPTHDEQAAIVRFLDHANRKIDRLIRVKRKLIALLNEQKQAIIHRAVTRGLNPDVPLKPSGLSWLGDIPVHWDIRPLKQSLSRMDYGTSESSSADGKFRVLTMGHIQNGRVLAPESGGIDHIPTGLFLKTNDLLFNRTNSPELVGKVGIFAGSLEPPVTFASYLVRLRVRPEHSPHWLNYLLNSFRFWAYARSQALVSLHQANLNSSRYGRMNLPIPPRAEQDLIVEQINKQTGSIEIVITRTEREIALMQEYRTRLTADVVTGKLDVREAAAKLPELEGAAELAIDADIPDEELFEDAEAEKTDE